MRRLKLAGACGLLMLAALPLLPGPGALIIGEALAALEQEFPSLGRLLDGVRARPVRPSTPGAGVRRALAHAPHAKPLGR
jgi:hypothetical protein